MKVVILGATKGIGRALARLFAERNDALVLLGRDPTDLERSARDLRVRGATVAGIARCDLGRPDEFAAALNDADRQLGGFDCVVVTAAPFGTQEVLENDPALAAEVLGNGFTNTVLFCEEARRRLQAKGGGTLAVFSSVAGERGRKPVVLYGAAKAGLSRYLEGLDHRFRSAGLRVVCLKPGFVKTGMTAGLKAPPFSTTAEVVARRALTAIDRGQPEVYIPGIWRWIMVVIRAMPRFVMRRVSF